MENCRQSRSRVAWQMRLELRPGPEDAARADCPGWRAELDLVLRSGWRGSDESAYPQLTGQLPVGLECHSP